MTNLQKLVSQHMSKVTDTAQTVNWELRKNKWLEVLNSLNLQIRTMLIKAGVPEKNITDTMHIISEESLGKYKAKGLKVEIGKQVITFTPVASVIIGGYGRVDVNGPQGEVKLIADDADSARNQEDKTPSYERDWIWIAYPAKSRKDSYKFDEEGLVRVIEQTLGRA